MKNKLLITFISLFIHLVVFSQGMLNAGVEKVFPFSNTSVTLNSSWIKQREDLNIKYLLSLDPDRLLHNFKVSAGLPSNAKPLEGWEAPQIGLRGHFAGHYLSDRQSPPRDCIVARRRCRKCANRNWCGGACHRWSACAAP